MDEETAQAELQRAFVIAQTERFNKELEEIRETYERTMQEVLGPAGRETVHKIVRLEREVRKLRRVIGAVHGPEALYDAELAQCIEDLTSKMEEHPEGYDGPCWCRLCKSYGAEDGIQS